MQRIIAIFIATVVVSGLLFAGGQEENAAMTERPTLSVWAVTAAEIPIDTENLQNWQAIEDAVGVDLDWEIVSAQAKDQNFNLLMASGDLPDIVAYYDGSGGRTSIDRFGSEGAFLPLQDMIMAGAPNLEARLITDRKVAEQITAQDGNIYQVPMMAAINAARGWFIRQDWLDKLGLEKPTTTDELFDVLVAFRDGDPNGNGEKDEIPLVFRRRGDDAFYNIMAFAYAFDADMDWVVRGDKVVFGPSEDAYRDYLAYIQKLYGAKLIDQEVLTRQGNPRTELFTANRGGALHDWFASTAGLNDTLPAKIAGFELTHFAPPVGTADKPYTRIQMSTVRADGGWSISATNPYPEKTIELFDYVYSDKGIDLTNFGIEGVTYKRETNGFPRYTSLITDNPDGLSLHEALVSNGMQWKIGMVQDIDYENQFANKTAFEARKDYMDNYIVPEFPTLSFTPQEQDIVTDKFSQIRSYVLEMTARFMVGKRDVSTFASFQKELNDLGLDEVTKIYQAAYDRKYK